MSRKKSVTLTEVEQRLMEVLWERGDGTVGEVLEGLPRRHKAAFNTVQTTMRILEAKGYLRHEAEGRAFRYFPTVDRDAASSSAVKNLLKRFFGGDPAGLAMNLIETDALTLEELDRIESLIKKAKKR